jgi:fucose 4-O-acetylase-like acetyltransferase
MSFSIDSSKRNMILDYAKGVAILLVIIGHAIQFSDPNYIYNYCYNTIYSFHMPLFMFISGFVSYNSLLKNTFSDFFMKKFTSLLYPFILFSIFFVYYFNKTNGLLSSISFIIHSPGDVYWFLYILFVLSILFYILIRINNFNKFLASVIYVSILLIPSYDYGLSLIKNMSVYYLLGMFTYIKKEKIKSIIKKYTIRKNKIILLSLFLLSGFLYHKHNNFYYEFFGIMSVYIKLFIYMIKFFLALVGIGVSFLVASFLSELNIQFISEIGIKYTLHLYILHYYFLTIVQTRY